MKKLILLFGTMFWVGMAWAAGTPSVWRSSFTNTAETTKNICGNDAGITTNRRGFFHGVCASSTAVNGVMTVYNSSASAINPIGVFNSVAGNCEYFDVIASTQAKGLTYSTVGSGNFTILYDCY